MNRLLKIIKHYGIEHQQRKFNEEVFELQEAIINYENGNGNKKDIAGEIADCYNMLGQFMEYYEIPQVVTNRIQLFKQDRQLKRIENEAQE